MCPIERQLISLLSIINKTVRSSVVDPNPHILVTWIRIRSKSKSGSASKYRHLFADYRPKCMKYKFISALFQGFKPLFGSWDPHPDLHEKKKIRIRIHNSVTKYKCIESRAV
jgi:hypothetical protein